MNSVLAVPGVVHLRDSRYTGLVITMLLVRTIKAQRQLRCPTVTANSARRALSIDDCGGGADTIQSDLSKRVHGTIELVNQGSGGLAVGSSRERHSHREQRAV